MDMHNDVVANISNHMLYCVRLLHGDDYILFHVTTLK